MSQIKTKQQEKESGSWNDLPPQQRQEQEGLLRQLGMMARYHNVMANHTIHALQQLTTHIKSIFCHPTFVDRLSAMLNYFLCQLVSNLRVCVCMHACMCVCMCVCAVSYTHLTLPTKVNV